MEKTHVLIALERDWADINKVYRSLNRVFDMQYEVVESEQGLDAVANALYAVRFGHPFQLLVLYDFWRATAKTVHGRQELCLEEVVSMIRALRAYKKEDAPIVVSSDSYYPNRYHNLGITVWVHPDISENELEHAIKVAMRMDCDVLNGDHWCKVHLTD